MNEIILRRSNHPDKKYSVQIDTRTIHFGARGMSDYTIHKDPERMKRYCARHRDKENWKKSGLRTAGFWSRWILWNLPDLKRSIADTERRFNIRIITRFKV